MTRCEGLTPAEHRFAMAKGDVETLRTFFTARLGPTAESTHEPDILQALADKLIQENFDPSPQLLRGILACGEEDLEKIWAITLGHHGDVSASPENVEQALDLTAHQVSLRAQLETILAEQSEIRVFSEYLSGKREFLSKTLADFQTLADQAAHAILQYNDLPVFNRWQTLNALKDYIDHLSMQVRSHRKLDDEDLPTAVAAISAQYQATMDSKFTMLEMQRDIKDSLLSSRYQVTADSLSKVDEVISLVEPVVV